VENLRKLCTNLGISNTGSHSKFNSNLLLVPGIHGKSWHQTHITCIKAVNVVFSANFIEDFKMVNDQKSRQDHETKNICKAFWIRAALVYNACMQAREDEAEIVLVEKATSPSKNGETIVGPMERTADRAISFPDSDNSDDYGSNASLSSGGGGGMDNFGAIVVYPLDDEASTMA
jgi:hypothetical protein